MTSIAPVAATKLSDVLRPRSNGETVNVHVVENVEEPKPDFAAMQRLIESGSSQRVASVVPEHLADGRVPSARRLVRYLCGCAVMVWLAFLATYVCSRC